MRKKHKNRHQIRVILCKHTHRHFIQNLGAPFEIVIAIVLNYFSQVEREKKCFTRININKTWGNVKNIFVSPIKRLFFAWCLRCLHFKWVFFVLFCLFWMKYRNLLHFSKNGILEWVLNGLIEKIMKFYKFLIGGVFMRACSMTFHHKFNCNFQIRQQIW